MVLEHAYRVRTTPGRHEEWLEMHEWCELNCEPNTWMVSVWWFYFKNAQDATMFALKWS